MTHPGGVDKRGRRGAVRADAMLETGDLDGAAVWKRILRAVDKLQRVEPGGGARVN